MYYAFEFRPTKYEMISKFFPYFQENIPKIFPAFQHDREMCDAYYVNLFIAYFKPLRCVYYVARISDLEFCYMFKIKADYDIQTFEDNINDFKIICNCVDVHHKELKDSVPDDVKHILTIKEQENKFKNHTLTSLSEINHSRKYF
jgi:hypothetical protein